MRFAAACLLWLTLSDITPRGPEQAETRWDPGDFVVAATEPLDRLVNSGECVGLKLSGRGESCLLRREVFPFRPQARLRFRMRWSDAGCGNAYPSVHVLFNPPGLDDAWWNKPMQGGQWAGRIRTLLFHFSTDPEWRVLGSTQSFESAAGRHRYSPPENKWIAVEIRFKRDSAEIFVDGKEVAACPLDLKEVRTFTYGIGDQTSTYVELDEFVRSR
jgi:hypothetical protein